MAHLSINGRTVKKRRIAIHFFCWVDGGPSLNLSFPPAPHNFILSPPFICGCDQCFPVLLILFPRPPMFLLGLPQTNPHAFWSPYTCFSFFFSFFFLFFLLLRPSGWGSVFVQWDWSACVGFVAITPCIPACVCVPVQCCVQGTEACPSKRTTTGLFSHNPPHLVRYLD